MSARSEKILQGMRNSTANWTRDDLDTLYLGFGFIIRTGAKHDIVKHPKYPHLRATVPKKHRYLAIGYVTYAVKLVDELKSLQVKGD